MRVKYYNCVPQIRFLCGVFSSWYVNLSFGEDFFSFNLWSMCQEWRFKPWITTVTSSQSAGRPLPWDEKRAKSSLALTPEFPIKVCHPVYSSHLCPQHIPSLVPHPRLKAPSHPQGKPNKLVKTKTETYLNRPSFWLPAKQQLCHSQCDSSIYPPLLITDVWPKPLALMLCERSGRTYQCHATPGQQQPAMATPSQKQLKRRSQ